MLIKYYIRRLCFFGKSDREDASWTESASEMSSKYGNTPGLIQLNILEWV